MEIIKNNMPLFYEDEVLDIKASDHLINDLCYESISLMQLIIEIEERFNIVFDAEINIESILIVDDLFNLVKELILGRELKENHDL